MAKLWIKEYKTLGDDNRAVVQAPMEAGTDQTPVDFSGGAAESAAFDSETRIILLQSDTDCHIAFGPNPSATTDNEPLTAGSPKHKTLDKNSGLKVSVIAAA